MTYFRDEQLDLPSASCCSRRSWGRCGAWGGEGGESGGGVTLLQEEGGQTWRRESCEPSQSNREDAPVLYTQACQTVLRSATEEEGDGLTDGG